MPPAPTDPATTVRAPSLPKGPDSDSAEIIVPPSMSLPKTTIVASPDDNREALLLRLRERVSKMSPAQVSALLKLVE
jgi:hypothetical protein